MTDKEAINYLIPPVSTSTEPSTQYLKQKEAYDLAIIALEFAESQRIWGCDNCIHRNYKSKKICGQCEFFEDKTQKGAAE